MLSRNKVFQTIKEGKRKLHIEEMTFKVKYADTPSEIGKRAEIFIWSETEAEIVLYPDATLFTVHHELCHAKLYKMGFPLTNTPTDRDIFPDQYDYMQMVVIVEWYISELQKRIFHEYYATDEAGTPRPPPFLDVPKLPTEKFTAKQINDIITLAKKREGGNAVYM
jgi:hypothetical protein